MDRLFPICAVVVAACANGHAQQVSPIAAPAADDPAERLRWAGTLHDAFSQMQDPVAALYGKARLAALVCGLDKAAGTKLFQEAVRDLGVLPDNAFDAAKMPLPVSTFSDMWTLVVPAARACNQGVPWDDASVSVTKRDERPKANDWLSTALKTHDAERAAQLADAAMSVGSRRWGAILTQFRSPDLFLLVKLLIKLGASAPDLSDALFQKAVYGPGILVGSCDLEPFAKYLFPAAPSVPLGLDDKFYPHTGDPADRPSIPNIMHAPLRAAPDVAAAFLKKIAQTVDDYASSSAQPYCAYTLAYQMLPKARLYDAEDVSTFEFALSTLESQPAAHAEENRASLGPLPPFDSTEMPGDDDFVLASKLLTALRASRSSAAHAQLSEISNSAVRGQLEGLISFFETAQILPTREAERLLSSPVYPDPGVRRALLYTSIASSASTPENRLKAVDLALHETDSLPAALKICLLPALASAALPASGEKSLGVFGQLVTADNELSNEPPTKDPPAIRCSPAGVLEAVDTSDGRQNILLRVPGVSTYTLDSFLAQARTLDFSGLEQAIRLLHDSTHFVKALATLADLRLHSGSH